MAIKRKASATYIADTGKEFEVSEMADSHLLNVIAHHQKQVEALAVVYNRLQDTQRGYLTKRLETLAETINILGIELANRDPDTEEQRRSEYVEKKWGVRDSGY